MEKDDKGSTLIRIGVSGESSFWYRPTRVVPDQRPLNGRCCCRCYAAYYIDVSQYYCCLTPVLLIIFNCSVINMPERLTVYTTLVGLLNSKNHNAGGEVMCTYVLLFEMVLSL